jgi:hypothetical protein
VRLPEISYIDGKAVRAVFQAGPLLLYQLLFGRLSGVPQRWNWSVDWAYPLLWTEGDLAV